jgi:hypothetical protein
VCTGLFFLWEGPRYKYFYDCRIEFLRHMRDFFQLVYKVEVKEEVVDTEGDGEEEEERDTITRQLVTLSCVGVGYSNYSKGIM